MAALLEERLRSSFMKRELNNVGEPVRVPPWRCVPGVLHDCGCAGLWQAFSDIFSEIVKARVAMQIDGGGWGGEVAMWRPAVLLFYLMI
jgi:hypothetical protein